MDSQTLCSFNKALLECIHYFFNLQWWGLYNLPSNLIKHLNALIIRIFFKIPNVSKAKVGKLHTGLFVPNHTQSYRRARTPQHRPTSTRAFYGVVQRYWEKGYGRDEMRKNIGGKRIHFLFWPFFSREMYGYFCCSRLPLPYHRWGDHAQDLVSAHSQAPVPKVSILRDWLQLHTTAKKQKQESELRILQAPWSLWM